MRQNEFESLRILAAFANRFVVERWGTRFGNCAENDMRQSNGQLESLYERVLHLYVDISKPIYCNVYEHNDPEKMVTF